MHKHKTYRFFSFFMAVLLFFSSSGLAMDVHFCGGDFKRMNLIGKAKTCKEVAACIKNCCAKQGKKIQIKTTCGADGEHKGCCENRSFVLNLDFDAAEVITTELTPIQLQFLSAYVFNQLHEQVDSKDQSDKFKYYLPPKPKRNLPVWFQCFLL